MSAGTNRIITPLIVVFILATTTPAFAGRIIYVDDDGPADFNNIQAAIDDSIHGDTVIIMPGVYTGSGNRNIDFKSKAITFRSTDPTDPNVVAATVIDLNYSGIGFDFQGGEDANSIVDGITIINGRRIRGYEFYSGGISCTYSSPTIRNCVIRECAGDGIDLWFSDAIIKNCVIRENNRWSDENTAGAGIVCSDLSPLISNCIINNNYQGGLLCWSGYPTVINCTFTGNHGLYNPYEKASFGGSILLHGGDLSVINCTFNGNTADMGGSICNFAMFGSNMNNLAINNCIFGENKSNNGPQIALKRHPGSNIPPTVTVSYSDVQGGEAAVYVEPQCTLNWGDGNIDVGPFFIDSGYWDPNGTVEDANDDFWVDGDYHLKSQAGRWNPNSESWVRDDVTSPCIDSGNPGCPLRDEPNGLNNVRINMGAYGGTAEASKSPPYWRSIADTTNDWVVDSNDLKIFCSYWLQMGECLPGDFDRSLFVGFNDFAIFGGQWRQKGPGPTTSYQIGNCVPPEFGSSTTGPMSITRFTVTVQGQYVLFEDMMQANCCPDELELQMTVEDNLITIYEIEHITMPCTCICNYPITATLGPFQPGSYTLEVYEDGTFIGTTNITIENAR
jgi:parallel beta-helix repeat protein